MNYINLPRGAEAATARLIIYIMKKMFYLFITSVLVVSVAKCGHARGAYDYDLYESVLDPELCQKHLMEMSAFEFYDASFRFPQSILRGNAYSLGNYHQCLNINQPIQDDSVRGKYCLIQTESLQLPVLTGHSWPPNVTWMEIKNVRTENTRKLEAYNEVQRSFLGQYDDSRSSIIDIIDSVPMTLALCIPRTCTVEDVLRPLVDTPFVDFQYTEDFCRLPDDKPFSAADVTAVVIFSIIGLLTLLSTAYELHHIFIKRASLPPRDILCSFSVYRNTSRLMSIDSKPGALDCVDGIRSLSILWVIFGHTFLLYYGSYLSNVFDYYEWSANLRTVVLRAANVSVDSFFTLSGLLLVYTTANKMNQMQLVKSLHLFYLHRLLRMFPLLAAAVLLQASLAHHSGDGVRWEDVATNTQWCRDYWWSALLHVQNIVNTTEICLPHTWYLSVDVQLHILSPLLLFWILGSRRSAWIGLATGVLASISFVIIYSFIKQWSGYHDIQYVVYFYHNTFARAPSFIVGMLCGYVLHVHRGKQMKMHPIIFCVGSALAIFVSCYCLYHVHPGWTAQLWITLNTALMRGAWSASLCWLILICVNGYSGPINWLLSLKMWKFMARISYALYIFHYPLQFISRGTIVTPIYFSIESAFMYFASDVTYAIIVSVAACVLFDAPFSTLIRRAMTVIAPVKSSPARSKKQDANDTNDVQPKIETE